MELQYSDEADIHRQRLPDVAALMSPDACFSSNSFWVELHYLHWVNLYSMNETWPVRESQALHKS